MAAHYWRLLLLGELICATAMATLAKIAFEIPMRMAVLAGVGVLLLLPGALAGISFAVAHLMRPSRHSSQGCIESMRAWVRESIALERVTLAMSMEPWLGFDPGNRRGGAPGLTNPVMLIHGVVCNRGVWGPMARALRAHGFGPIGAVNLEPPLASIGSHAEYIAKEIRQLRQACGGARVAIIAHSMGGLVARDVLRALRPDDISRIVTLGSPHHGSSLARIPPGLPFRQMEPDSRWLAELNAAQEGHFLVPITCIYSAHDNLIRPIWSAALEGATRIELEGLGHLSLLSSRAAIDSALAALKGSHARREPCLT